ncbi:MAG: hypothetical protein GF365_00880 [Candidatus Buchananbacteria bacterium]|nr:hypothetical protein [Candidatus Buchananbacteria bacterium]
MVKIQEHQIAQLLLVAKEQLTYCEYIEAYAQQEAKNYAPGKLIDQFYKNIHNTCFNDSLLIISNLIDKDSRVISLWNWTAFKDVKEKKLEQFINSFKKEGLKTIRDQIVAHTDVNNHNNNFPSSKRRGMVNEILVQRLSTFLDDLIVEFYDYTANHSTPYSPQYFDVSQAKEEIQSVMDKAKPEMTDVPEI